MTDHPTQLLRAVANSLWPYLRRGAAGWTRYRVRRSLSPTNSQSAGRTPGAYAPPQPTTELISEEQDIRTLIWDDDWPQRTNWAIHLQKPHADATLARLPVAVLAEYETALEHSTCRKPFTVETTPDGQKLLTRNRHDGLITDRVTIALEALARAADLRPLPPDSPEVLDALLTDDDVPDGPNLDAVLAARQLAELDRENSQG